MEEAGQFGTEQQHSRTEFEAKILELANAAAEAKDVLEAAQERFVGANFLLTREISRAEFHNPNTYNEWFESLSPEQKETILKGSEDPFSYIQVE
jgi:hypothetical protein